MRKKLHLSLGKLLLRQFYDYWWMYTGAILCLTGLHLCQSYLPFLAKELGDYLLIEPERISLWSFVFLAIGIFLFRSSSRLLFFTPARYLEKDLRIEMMRKVEKTIPLRYAKHSAGQVFQVIFNDIMQIRGLVGFALLQVGNVVVAFAVLIPKINNFNSNLVLGLLPLIISVGLFALIVHRFQPYYRKVQDSQGDVQNFIIESYEGKRTIKNYQSELSFIALFRKVCSKELNFFYKASLGPALSVPFIPLGVGLSFLLGAYIIQKENLGDTSLILFSGFIYLLLEPLMFLSWIGVVFSRSRSSWDRIKEFLYDLDKPVGVEEKLLAKNSFPGRLERKEPLDLEVPFWEGPISFPLNEKKWTVFIGRTGSGKSYLLTRVADILKLNGFEVSLVSGEPYLFNDSIQGNIFLGREPNKKQLELAYELIELFALTELASTSQKVLKMEVGENGKMLSGGQAKRICLIRSLLAEVPYILWDDPFSSVDVFQEKKIISKLRELDFIRQKTFVLSSHRLSTVRFCDNIIFLDKKKGILEIGDTSELLKGKSQSSEYFEKQYI